MAPPPRPARWKERLADASLIWLAPKVNRVKQPDPPESLRPWEALTLENRVGATWYPAVGRGRGVVSEAAASETSRGLRRGRGVVLLAPPWVDWGQSYFHRRGRIEALREAGYHSLSFDMGGFGRTRSTRGFRDRDAEIALREAKRRAGDLPVHVWGVSSGGLWLHPILARERLVTSAFFEDVSPHLLEWSAYSAPRARNLYRALQRAFPHVNRYMDMRNHTPLLVDRCAYVVGSNDRGIPVEDAQDLAKRAGGALHVFEGAGHLQAIKRERERVIRLALDTFR